MLKRIFAALLLAATTFTAVACSSGGTSSTDTTTAGGDTTAAETTTTVETSEYTAPDATYDGKTITVGAVDYVTTGTAGSWKATGYIEVMAFEENGDPLNDAIYERNRRVEEELDVDIELYSFTSFSNIGSEFLKPILASEDTIDFAMVNGSNLTKVLGTGYVLELNEFGLDLSYSWWDQNSVEEFTLYDQIHTVTGDISLYNNYAPITLFFNKVLANNYDLGNPYEIVTNGEWTIDKLIEMCQKVAGDVNGNGEIDIEDRFGMCAEGATMNYMIHSIGERFTKKDADGDISLSVNTERTATLIEKFVPFMRDKAVNMFNGDFSGYKNVFTDLFLPTFTDDRALFYNNQLLVALNLRDMEADFGILPTPKYDEMQDDYSSPYSTWWATFVCIPATNSQAEMTVDTIQAMGYYAQQLITPAYIDSTITGKTLRDEESIAMLEVIMGNRVYDIGQVYNWGGIASIGSELVNGQSTAFASKYESMAEKVQTAIDTTVELLK